MKSIYKAVIRYKLITKGRKIIGVDPESRRVEYLPADEEGRKAFEWFINHLYEGLVEYLKTFGRIPTEIPAPEKGGDAGG